MPSRAGAMLVKGESGASSIPSPSIMYAAAAAAVVASGAIGTGDGSAPIDARRRTSSATSDRTAASEGGQACRSRSRTEGTRPEQTSATISADGTAATLRRDRSRWSGRWTYAVNISFVLLSASNGWVRLAARDGPHDPVRGLRHSPRVPPFSRFGCGGGATSGLPPWTGPFYRGGRLRSICRGVRNRVPRGRLRQGARRGEVRSGRWRKTGGEVSAAGDRAICPHTLSAQRGNLGSGAVARHAPRWLPYTLHS